MCSFEGAAVVGPGQVGFCWLQATATSIPQTRRPRAGTAAVRGAVAVAIPERVSFSCKIARARVQVKNTSAERAFRARRGLMFTCSLVHTVSLALMYVLLGDDLVCAVLCCAVPEGP